MESNEINLLKILGEYDKIIIPEIQRDYVMGSGGKKLEDLFSAMNNSLQEKKFSFGCIVGYSDNKSLYVYDGQQRLATLICLCSILNTDEDKQSLFNKFEFIGREQATKWITNPENIDENSIVDFTIYSLLNLKKSFEDKWLKKDKSNSDLILDFLQKYVYFDMVLVDKVSDAEQFFMDINDGLDLKPYEIYKAALYHRASMIPDKIDFKKFALKMENEWLNYFSKYKNDKRKVCEEEVLIYFLKYCFRMMWIEEKGNDKEYVESDVTWLTQKHFIRIEKIIDAILKIHNDNCEDANEQIINYSIDTKGPHWNITYKNYSKMLNTFFHNIGDIEETKKDIIVWCYISLLPDISDKNVIDEHLRMIKKILNHNRFEYEKADILFNNWGVSAKSIPYARYYVKGIPKYYLIYRTRDYYTNDMFSDYEGFFNEIIKNNKKIDLTKWKTENLLKHIIDKEILKKKSSNYQEIIAIENFSFINGIVDNFLEYNYENSTCDLKHDFTIKLQNLELSKDKYPYKDILKFICDEKLKIDNFWFNDVQITWKAYTGTQYWKVGTIIPHTWCDFFTINHKREEKKTCIQNKIDIFESSEDSDFNYDDSIPDGWFIGKNLMQPVDSKYKGFAAYHYNITTVFKLY